ncbi:MAG TPA: hypothetical protein VMI75_25640 [Polyangiaceae bacterium]|nr:hypothetical protein [Polyangiaceae bacterium]
MDRKRLLRLLLLGAALVVAMLLARHWPKEQTVHYVLGDGAARVEEVDARWAEGRSSEDWTREATFRYAPGQAPRILTHEPRLPDGDYTVEIEIAAADASRNVVRRNVTLTGGGSTSIDLADSVPR